MYMTGYGAASGGPRPPQRVSSLRSLHGDAVRLGWGKPGRPTGDPATPAEGASTRDARLDDHLIPAAVQTSAPARAQMSFAVSKPSLTTVDSMLVASTHVEPRSDAGSVVLGLAGSVVVPFKSAGGTVLPERRMSANATTSWASL